MISNVGSSLSQQIPNTTGAQQNSASKLAAYQQAQPQQKAEDNKVQQSREAETATAQPSNKQSENTSTSGDVQAISQAAEQSNDQPPTRGSIVDIAV